MKKTLKALLWTAIALGGAGALGAIALERGERVSATWFIIAAGCFYLVGYRFYSAFLAARVLALDETRATPAERRDDGRDFVPTNKWVLMGHHFAAIAGPGPLIGPTLAAQFGYLPGTLWLIVGAVLGGCVQDFTVLAASIRRDGKSLGQMAREEVSKLSGMVALFAVLAMGISCARFWRDVGIGTTPVARGLIPALRDGFTLRHLHGSGEDCTSDLDVRRPWRRWFHHFTLYGFLLCFASTTVAAFYHTVLGWHAPYGYTSAPVILGTLGGLGLMVGPAGLAVQRRRRDPQLTDADSKGLDASLLALLFVTSATGLALLVLRHERAMGVLLIVHLGSVLALFLTLPYGKFVHGLYRLLALVKYHTE